MTEQFRMDPSLYAPLEGDSEMLGDEIFADIAAASVWKRTENGRPDPVETPDFSILHAASLAVFGTRTRDARALGPLALAEAGLGGPAGLARGVDLVAAWLVDHWDILNPRDIENDGEFFDRMEALQATLAADRFRCALEITRICEIPGLGAISLRAFLVAHGAAAARGADDEHAPDMLRRALAANPDSMGGLRDAIEAAAHAEGRLAAIAEILRSKPEAFSAVDIANGAVTELVTLCTQVRAALGSFVDEGVAPAGQTAPEGDAAQVSAAREPVARADAIESRDEAFALMDDITRFYAQKARSSPIPLALIALRDLMEADFNRWIKETANKGLETAALDIGGVEQARLDDIAPAGGAPAPPDTGALGRAADRLGETLAAQREANALTPDAMAALQADLDALRGEIGALDGSPTQPGAAPPIADRAAVADALERLAAFFERNEPSSPAPIYLRRLRGLVEARFPAIVGELMRDGAPPRLTLMS